MTTYSIKQNCKVYIVRGSSRYKLEVYPDLGFSQTFEEKTQSLKTLHDPSALFDGAIINKANPANFNFTVMLGLAKDYRIISSWLTLAQTYDIYIDTGVKIFKLEKGVIERATFAFLPIVTVSITGTAAKLSEVSALPASTLAIRNNDKTIMRSLRVLYDSKSLAGLTSLSVEYVNNIKWIDYDTIHKSLYVTNVSDTQYPENFVVTNRVLSGTIQQYLTEESGLPGWTTNTSLRIMVGDYFGINLPSVVATVNVIPDDIFTQTITFRLNTNPEGAVNPVNKGSIVDLNFTENNYDVTDILVDEGSIFLFENIGAGTVLDFTRNTYAIY